MATYKKTRKGITDPKVKWIVTGVKCALGTADLALVKHGKKWAAVAVPVDGAPDAMTSIFGEGNTIDEAADAWVSHAARTAADGASGGSAPVMPVEESSLVEEPQESVPVEESGSEPVQDVAGEGEAESGDADADPESEVRAESKGKPASESETPDSTKPSPVIAKPLPVEELTPEGILYAANKVAGMLKTSVALCSAAQVKKISRAAAIRKIEKFRADVAQVARESRNKAVTEFCRDVDSLMSNHLAVADGGRGEFPSKKAKRTVHRRVERHLRAFRAA